MKYGFLRVAACVPEVRVADCDYNAVRLQEQMIQANSKGVQIIVFPELCITGYTCQDLFSQQLLLEEAQSALVRLLDFSQNVDVISIVGLPLTHNGTLLNCAAVISKGKLLGLVPKTYLPNYGEFYEQRWFTSADAVRPTQVILCGQSVPLASDLIFEADDFSFGIEICEDLWATTPPSATRTLQGADIIFNLSASNEAVGKSDYVRKLIEVRSATSLCGYIYAGAGFGESTQDMVFGGHSYIAENGTMLAEGSGFALQGQLLVSEIDVQLLRAERRRNTTFAHSAQSTPSPYARVELAGDEIAMQGTTLTRHISPTPFIPQGEALEARCQEVLFIQAQGLAKRLLHTRAEHVVLGVSGGLDSTLALLVCAYAFNLINKDRKGIIGVTMPGFGTTDHTYNNAIALMDSLGVHRMEVDIKAACLQHFEDIGHNPDQHDVTYENAQARERTQILMDLANKYNGFVIGTGDLSELALGWATYNGDHMSMYGVNASVPKTLIRHLILWVAQHESNPTTQATLRSIADTPISPELLPATPEGEIAQITEDLVGPYELHDFFIYYTLRYGFRPQKVFMLAQRAFAEHAYTADTIKHWLTTFYRRFFAQQFKRSCMPDGPKVGSVSLSPRGDWRMPSDAESALWLKECEAL